MEIIGDPESDDFIALELGRLALQASNLEGLVAWACYDLMGLDVEAGSRLVNSMDSLLKHIVAFAPLKLEDDQLAATQAAVVLARTAWSCRNRVLHSTWRLHRESGTYRSGVRQSPIRC